MRILASPGIASGNPYIELLYSHLCRHTSGMDLREFSPAELRRAGEAPTVWHLHWPESVADLPNARQFVAHAGRFAVSVALAHRRGVRIVWTIHNSRAHEGRRRRAERMLMRHFVGRLDGAIALSSAGLAEAQRIHPGLRGRETAIIPHGHYLDSYPNDVDRTEARARLGLPANARVLLFFGQLRPYKNVPALAVAFSTLSGRDLRLVIAGRSGSAGHARQVRDAARADPRILPVLDWIPRKRVQLFMNAADLVVLPFRRILHSGTVILALSFRRPVLVPAQGAMRELKRRVGHEYIQLYEGAVGPDVLKSALEAVPIDDLGADRLTERMRSILDWDHIAVHTRDFLNEICGIAVETAR